MNFMYGKNARLTLCTAAFAATVFFATGSGLPVGVAAAAPLAPQAGFEVDAGAIVPAKDKGLKCCGKGGGGGGKDDKGDHHHHHHGWGPAIGSAIVALGYCAIQSERCEETYGEDTYRYWRCMRRAGCSD